MSVGLAIRALAARALVQGANLALEGLEWILFPHAPAQPKRVGILRVGMVGDVLAALPAVRAVAGRYPRAQLVWLTSPGPEGAPGAHELLGPDPNLELLRWHREDLATRAGRRSVLRRLRAANLDRVFLLPQERTTFRSEVQRLIALRLAGVRGVRGARVATAAGLPAPFRSAFDRTVPGVPETERLLKLVRSRRRRLGVESRVGRPAGITEAVSTLLPGADEPLLAISPGAKLGKKRWPEESFVAIARRWIEFGGRIVLLGSPAERALCERIRDETVDGRSEERVAVLAGELDLLGSAEALRQSRVSLANDSGAMHLAAEVGTPGVGLFSGMDRPGTWTPPVAQTAVLRGEAPCSPCLDRPCLVDRACLRSIDEEEVWRQLLNRAGEGRRTVAQLREGPRAPLPRATAEIATGR